MKEPTQLKLVKAAELAEMVSCSVRHVWALKKLGAIPFVSLGSSIRFDPQAVMDALSERSTTEKKPAPARN
jgi:hypothetical protein